VIDLKFQDGIARLLAVMAALLVVFGGDCLGQASTSEEGRNPFHGYSAGPEGARAILKDLMKGDVDRRALTLALRPRSQDYASVFTPEVVEIVEARYAALWNSSPPVVIAPKEGQTELLLWSATTEALRNHTGMAKEFPGGYRGATPYLKDGLIWYRFKFVEPGMRIGMAYDGLVHVNGRWCWFPKSWRVLPKNR
jgi:hypothetical protein